MPLFCVLALLNSLIVAKEIYQSIRVYHPTQETNKTIGSLGIPLDHVSGKEGIFLDLTVTESETIELMSREIEIEGGDSEDDDSPLLGLLNVLLSPLCSSTLACWAGLSS